MTRTPHADPDVLAACLGGGGPVERRETHGSIVFLTADDAVKLKKPLWFDFADLRGLAERAAACREEAAANLAFGNHFVVGARAVVPAADGYRLDADDAPGAIDHVVLMRRFRERDTLAARIAAGAVPLGAAAACGAAIAGVHTRAAPAPDAPTPRDLATRNLVGLTDAAADLSDPARIAAAARFSLAFLDAWDDVLARRRSLGRVIDGHGDLRAEHLLVPDDGDPVLLDRLEHRWMRLVDVADDLAFLRMDLAALAANDVWDDVLDGYLTAGGPPPPPALLAYFATYRALVRAKVGYVRARQTGDAADRRAADRFLALGERFAADARGPLTLLVTGPPASGKSTLADALSTATARPVLSSDSLRLAVASGYDHRARAAVYAALGATAAAAGSGSIVDATFGAPGLRAAFLDAYRREGGVPLAAVVLRGPADLLARRAGRRGRDPHGSEAGPAVAVRLAADFTPIDELPAEAVLTLEAALPCEAQADAVLAWLDARLAAAPAVA